MVERCFNRRVSGSENRAKEGLHPRINRALRIAFWPERENARLILNGVVDLIQGDFTGVTPELNAAILPPGEFRRGPAVPGSLSRRLPTTGLVRKLREITSDVVAAGPL